MTSGGQSAGAPLNSARKWKSINWKHHEREVKRLQMRIAKATQSGKWNKVKVLQRLLTRSYSAKLLAVRRVSANKGSKTPGIDNVLWRSNTAKMNAVYSLKQKGYKAQPLRRIKIPKKNGKWRILGIPVMYDRAMQALYLLALEPVSETTADPNSYGFRVYRACRDAIAQCFIILARTHSPKWIFEGDIRACFDGISHQWLMDNVPLEKKMLEQWLKCGYVENSQLFPTDAGTPQGGIISPILANMALDGLEAKIKSLSKRGRKINFIRYADDFIITASSRAILQKKVMPILKSFLNVRGLELSEEKTAITHIRDGFDFLGCSIRKYGKKYQMKPSKDAVKQLYTKVRELVKSTFSWKTDNFIRKLNSILRGWANYHRYGSAADIFSQLDWKISNLILKVWLKRRHSNKTHKWLRKRYYRTVHENNWTFHARYKDKGGMPKFLDLIRLTDIQRYIYYKIKAKSNPFNPEYTDYFNMRKEARNVRPMTKYVPITLRSLTAGLI